MMELMTIGITALWGTALAAAAQLAWGAGHRSRSKGQSWGKGQAWGLGPGQNRRRRARLGAGLGARLARAAADLFVPVAAGAFVFYTLYRVNSGQVRAYVFLGLAAGWAVHRLFLRGLVSYVAAWASWWCRRAVRASTRSARRTSRRARASVQGFASLWRKKAVKSGAIDGERGDG